MKEKEYIFTSESVTEGHPDKMADQISDAILDYITEKDPQARVACETLVSNGFCVIAGELKTTAYAPMQEIAREVVRDIGYTDAQYGFDYRSAGVLNGVGEQSPDINQGVDKADGEIGAGDQGLMFGYACRDSRAYATTYISSTQDHSQASSSPKRWHATISTPRWQGSGECEICRWQAYRGDDSSSIYSA